VSDAVIAILPEKQSTTHAHVIMQNLGCSSFRLSIGKSLRRVSASELFLAVWKGDEDDEEICA